jgi:hypothetical protein
MANQAEQQSTSIIGSLAGLAFIVLAVIGNEVAAGGAPDEEARLLRWLADHTGALYGGLLVEVVGLLLALVFAAYVMHLVSRRAGDWLVWLGVGGMASAVAIKLASLAPVLAGVEMADDLSPEVAGVLVRINDASFALFTAPIALFVLAAGVGALQGRGLPRWLAYPALLLSPLLVLNAVFGYPTGNVGGFLLFMLWTVVTSITLAVRAWRARGSVA